MITPSKLDTTHKIGQQLGRCLCSRRFQFLRLIKVTYCGDGGEGKEERIVKVPIQLFRRAVRRVAYGFFEMREFEHGVSVVDLSNYQIEQLHLLVCQIS